MISTKTCFFFFSFFFCLPQVENSLKKKKRCDSLVFIIHLHHQYVIKNIKKCGQTTFQQFSLFPLLSKLTHTYTHTHAHTQAAGLSPVLYSLLQQRHRGLVYTWPDRRMKAERGREIHRERGQELYEGVTGKREGDQELQEWKLFVCLNERTNLRVADLKFNSSMIEFNM